MLSVVSDLEVSGTHGRLGQGNEQSRCRVGIPTLTVANAGRSVLVSTRWPPAPRSCDRRSQQRRGPATPGYRLPRTRRLPLRGIACAHSHSPYGMPYRASVVLPGWCRCPARVSLVSSPVLLIGAWFFRGRSHSGVARSAIAPATRAQRAPLNVILRGERMPGAWRTARPARAGAVIGERWGVGRLPAGAGQPAGRQRPRPEGFRSKGAGRLPPPEQASPCCPPGNWRCPAPRSQSPAMTSASRITSPACGWHGWRARRACP